VSITLDKLVHPGLITMARMVELMSTNPARILGVPGGSLAAGAPADITILAPDLAVTIDKSKLLSKSKNTPFHGWTFRGGVAATIVGGRAVYTNPEVGLKTPVGKR
jgi:dihydroorotase